MISPNREFQLLTYCLGLFLVLDTLTLHTLLLELDKLSILNDAKQIEKFAKLKTTI
jgi:hypothetical protein